jgi:c-di-GMP-binding flagellar brake protein YcgR
MGVPYRPVAGQIVIVEPVDANVAERCLTGVVMPSSDDRVTIDLGSSGAVLLDGAAVVISVFSSEALYRLHGEVHPTGRSLVALDPVYEIERVQRRRSPRRALRLSVTLVFTAESDPDVSRVAGRSLDIGVGGLRVETVRPLPDGSNPIVILSVPDGAPMMLPTRVVTADVDEDGCEYRLAFTDLRAADADRLSLLVNAATAGR